MSDLTVARRNAIANYLAGKGAPTAIAGLFLDLVNGDPQAAAPATGTSVLAAVNGSPNRLAIKDAMGEAANGVAANTAVVTLVAASQSAAPVTATHAAFYDAQTGGALIGSHALATGTLTINQGNPVQFNAGALTITAG